MLGDLPVAVRVPGDRWLSEVEICIANKQQEIAQLPSIEFEITVEKWMSIIAAL